MSLLSISIIFFAVVITLTQAFPTFHNGRQHHVKLDPFVALAQTLKQEDLQQQQQRRPIHHRFPQSEADYEEDGQRSDEDDQQQPIDQWQIRQLQRQFGQAAMMMPVFQRQQRNWELEEQPEDYGVPIMSQEDDEEEDERQLYPENEQLYQSNAQLYPANGQLYQDNSQLYQNDEEPVYSFFPKQNDNEDDEDEEKRLLMDTLFQYMYLAGNKDNNNNDQIEKDNVKRSESPKENETLTKINGQKEVSMGSQQKNMNKSQKAQQLEEQLLQQSKQQHITNSTNNSKVSTIVTPEDELIQELDTLKKKN